MAARRIALATAASIGVGATYVGYHMYQISYGSAPYPRARYETLNVPSRQMHIATLKEREFDVLVIGGGATGSGVALDGCSRGLSVALVEGSDFSSGTSSRSTKLIHGGVRYLQKAIMQLDMAQYRLVREALQERANLLDIAPHLSHPLPIMLPVYSWWKIPYFYAGIKMYDLVSGRQLLKPSYFLKKDDALEEFAMLKRDELKGAIVYYDGAHNDARMNLAIALTAAEMGATTVNHCSVVSLIKTEEGTVSGARVHDHMSGLEYDVKAKCVINATGPFVDNVRLMDNPSAKKLIQGSAGVHVVLPAYYSPRTMGLLDPETSDGRVIFFLPWEGKTLAGTTDEATEVTHSPSPSEAAVQFILNEVQNYLGPEIKVRRGDVLSAFSGIRPLVVNPDATDTQSVVRDHFVEVSDSGMVTITGGKWTTYRIMAADTVDAALRAHPELKAKAKRSSSTLGLMLTGGRSWNPMMHIQLSQDYGVDEDVALHLSHTYGDKAGEICAMAHMTGRRWPVVGRRLLEEFPVIEAEIKYATRKEYACTVVDVIARRTRLAFLNVEAAREVVPRIIQIMAKQLKWDEARCKKELADAEAFLLTMGRAAQLFAREKVPYKEVLSIQDIGEFTREFRAIAGPADVIRADELQRLLKMTGSEISTHQIRQLFDEVDTDESGSIELDEFLTLMANIKRGTVANSRLAHVVQMRNNDHSHRIPVDRSGGGV